MRQPGQAALIVRRSLFASDPIRIASFAVNPLSDACGDVERQDRHVMVLPFAGVFAKHEAPGRHVVGTPSHAVLIAADAPYRLAFPGAIGDRAIILRFDDGLVPEVTDRRPGERLASHGLLSAQAMMRRDLLRRRLADPVDDPLEIEALALKLLKSVPWCALPRTSLVLRHPCAPGARGGVRQGGGGGRARARVDRRESGENREPVALSSLPRLPRADRRLDL